MIVIGLQPIKTRAKLDSSRVFETNILRVVPVIKPSFLTIKQGFGGRYSYTNCLLISSSTWTLKTHLQQQTNRFVTHNSLVQTFVAVVTKKPKNQKVISLSAQ